MRAGADVRRCFRYYSRAASSPVVVGRALDFVPKPRSKDYLVPGSVCSQPMQRQEETPYFRSQAAVHDRGNTGLVAACFAENRCRLKQGKVKSGSFTRCLLSYSSMVIPDATLVEASSVNSTLY